VLRIDIFEGPTKVTIRKQEATKRIPKPFKLADNTAMADIAREAMLAFTRKLRGMPPSAALFELQQEGIGKRTLDWMLSTAQLDRERYGIDYRSLSLLAN